MSDNNDCGYNYKAWFKNRRKLVNQVVSSVEKELKSYSTIDSGFEIESVWCEMQPSWADYNALYPTFGIDIKDVALVSLPVALNNTIERCRGVWTSQVPKPELYESGIDGVLAVYLPETNNGTQFDRRLIRFNDLRMHRRDPFTFKQGRFALTANNFYCLMRGEKLVDVAKPH